MAFPSISTGAYRFPLERAAAIAMKETSTFLAANQSIEKIIFVCLGQSARDTHECVLNQILAWSPCAIAV